MLSRVLQRELHGLADQASDRLSDLRGLWPVYLATVSTLSPGQAGDGNTLVAVTWRGQEITCAGYASSYTPAVGHRVLCLAVDHQLVIAFRIVGYP